MRQELASIGFEDLMTAEAVESFIDEKASSAILVMLRAWLVQGSTGRCKATIDRSVW